MSLKNEVAILMRGVAATVVMPRFRMLADHEIAEKSPGEVVTVVDREAERLLYEGLEMLGIPARIVGEEAAAHQPELLDGIGEGLVWLIDPLDGTANFAAGLAPFGMMVALVEDGVPLAGWILDPVTGRLCHAEHGAGASCDGAPVRSQPTGNAVPVAALGTHFMTPDCAATVHALADERFKRVPVPRCAAESYPRLVLGQNDLALFQRTLPWDHAAGALFLTEAGGVVTDWTGMPYRVGRGLGILAAADTRLWTDGAEHLLGLTAGLAGREDCTA